MGDIMMKAHDRFVSEFEQMYSKIASEEKVPKECIETMKDLLKCIYYIELIEAMDTEEDEGYSRGYSGRGGYSNRSSYDGGYSGQRRNSMGRFSRAGGRSMTGRYSYDGERQNAMSRLQDMINNEPNGEVRMVMQNALRELEN